MKISKYTGFAVFFLLLCCISAGFAAQQDKIAALEAEFAEVQSAIGDIHQKTALLRQQIEQNQTEIGRLEDLEELSFFESRKLERLLRDSQELSGQVSRREQELTGKRELLASLAAELEASYRQAIRSRLDKIESQSPDEAARQQALEEIRQYRSRIAELRQLLGETQALELRIQSLQIDDDDSPGDITRKGDLLKDQEDKFRRLSEQLQERRADLEQELKLRSRLNEMVTDISVWDQQEEAVGNITGLNTQSESADLTGSIRGESGQVSESNVLAGKDFDITSLSLDQLEDAIAELAARQKRALTSADSLKQRADEFYQAAEKKKKQ